MQRVSRKTSTPLKNTVHALRAVLAVINVNNEFLANILRFHTEFASREA